jgi:hypothetical protein
MRVGRFATQFRYSLVGVFMLLNGWPAPAAAQDSHDHMTASAHHEETPAQKKRAGALVKAVREATEGFQNPAAAEYQHYFLNFGCVSGSDFGAMGMHFVNMDLVDGEIDVAHPEIVLYEPQPHGRLRLTGVDYLVPKEAWEADPAHTGPPELMGQLFHLFDAPNRFGLPAFYTLHVWAWKDNPNGTFTNWNPDVSCDDFAGEKP